MSDKNVKNVLISLFLLFLAAVLLYDFYVGFLSDNEFRVGVWVEFHGVIIEVILLVIGLNWWNTYRENKLSRPSRLTVAKKIYSLHIQLFNGFRYLMDPDYHTNPKSHGFPKGTSQEVADAWGKSTFVQYTPSYLSDLSKMVEYTNTSLGSEMLPMAVTYMEHSKELLANMEFAAKAYKNRLDPKYGESHGSIDASGLREMEQTFGRIKEMFPDICSSDFRSYTPKVELRSVDELIKLIELSNAKLSFLRMSINNNT
jgi:hypothetical protein